MKGGKFVPATSSSPHSGKQGTSKSRGIFEEEQKFISPGFQGVALYSRLALAQGRNEIVTTRMGIGISTSCRESASAAWAIATPTT
jgi:hypothetical protein